jgi:hypothetical protein
MSPVPPPPALVRTCSSGALEVRRTSAELIAAIRITTDRAQRVYIAPEAAVTGCDWCVAVPIVRRLQATRACADADVRVLVDWTRVRESRRRPESFDAVNLRAP